MQIGANVFMTFLYIMTMRLLCERVALPNSIMNIVNSLLIPESCFVELSVRNCSVRRVIGCIFTHWVILLYRAGYHGSLRIHLIVQNIQCNVYFQLKLIFLFKLGITSSVLFFQRKSPTSY